MFWDWRREIIRDDMEVTRNMYARTGGCLTRQPNKTLANREYSPNASRMCPKIVTTLSSCGRAQRGVATGGHEPRLSVLPPLPRPRQAETRTGGSCAGV